VDRTPLFVGVEAPLTGKCTCGTLKISSGSWRGSMIGLHGGSGRCQKLPCQRTCGALAIASGLARGSLIRMHGGSGRCRKQSCRCIGDFIRAGAWLYDRAAWCFRSKQHFPRALRSIGDFIRVRGVAVRSGCTVFPVNVENRTVGSHFWSIENFIRAGVWQYDRAARCFRSMSKAALSVVTFGALEISSGPGCGSMIGLHGVSGQCRKPHCREPFSEHWGFHLGHGLTIGRFLAGSRNTS